MLKLISPKHICLAHTRSIVRVRFAPSPTGFLHLGGLRTALYNFLFAKLNGGKFILRIEDTDQTRIVEGAIKQIQQDLNWAGMCIHEGPHTEGRYGPYVQSQRLNLYREQVHTLLDRKLAYRCFCTNKRLDLLRVEALRTRQIPKYDNRCWHLTEEEIDRKMRKNEPFCIRFKLTPGIRTFEDLIYGQISYDVALNEGDPVIFKSDGFPTYHFANVVDDHFMNISHVLRGVEWQISTTKHIMLYEAFGWKTPLFGHLPLLINPDGTKLSKRQGDIQLDHYRKSGILPLALINFITNSGGGFSKDQERNLKPKIYTMEELASQVFNIIFCTITHLVSQFDIKKINSHSGKLMPERLLEFNKLELERLLKDAEGTEMLISEIQNLVRNKYPNRISDDSLNLDKDYIKSTLSWAANRINKLDDLVSHEMAFLWATPTFDLKIDSDELTLIRNLNRSLEEQESFSKDDLKTFLKDFSERNGFKFSALMQLLRSILSGLKEGPSVAEMIEILGKDNTLSRLQTYINKYVT
ncbi:hypothetical protein FQR65_LT01239 [Abscondita terminalis]|nr:hypothetical protein FQR65_LT01239 [Abscondita terminalis]